MKDDQDTWRILRAANLCQLYKDYNRLEKVAQKNESIKLKIPACINYPVSKKHLRIEVWGSFFL